jgi:hypothetical protein
MTTIKQLYNYMEQNDLPSFEQLIRAHPECLYDEDGWERWLNKVARRGMLPFVKLLVNLGVDMNARSGDAPDDTALDQAAHEGRLEVVRWLLDHGAKVNFILYGEVRCTALTGAISNGCFDMVKLLVEHGANVNATGGGTTPLGYATSYGRTEIADYLRSVGAKPEGIPLPIDLPAGHQTIRDHFGKHRGNPTPFALPPVGPTEQGLAVYALPPAPGWDGYTVFTVGISDRHLLLEGTGFRIFIELAIYLPADWPMSPKALQDPKNNWPIVWLQEIGRRAHAKGRWPDELPGDAAVLFENGDPPAPLGPGTQQTCILSMPDPPDFGRISLPDGREVNVYSLYTLYTEEAAVHKAQGPRAVIELFAKHQIQRTVSPTRPNVAKP